MHCRHKNFNFSLDLIQGFKNNDMVSDKLHNFEKTKCA